MTERKHNRPLAVARDLGLALAVAGVWLAPTAARAERCALNAAGKWLCTYQQKNHVYASNGFFGGCRGADKTRAVRWQVPEGTPPAGGWPVVFFYQGTVPATEQEAKAFTTTTATFGGFYLTSVLHELLDDPDHTGKKYAVIAPEAPTTLFGLQYWDTNQLGSYSGKQDACFLPDLFNAVERGDYGPAAQFDMAKRFAFGISSGGYNTSRMAVSFNEDDKWAALAIVSASYATCAGPLCSVPSRLPANHPPTKFYHGTADGIVPIATMRTYFSRLQGAQVVTEKIEHGGGHEFTADVLGTTGIKAWFDRF